MRINATFEATFDDLIESFERDQLAGYAPSIREALPPDSHPLFPRVLPELVRVDMEYRWQNGEPVLLEDYCAEFPCLVENRRLLAELAFEEFRQRKSRGEEISAAQFVKRFSLDARDWPSVICNESPTSQTTAPVEATPEQKSEAENAAVERTLVVSPEAIFSASAAYLQFREQQGSSNIAEFDRLCERQQIPEMAARILRAAHDSNPDSALTIAEAIKQFPVAGTEFCGFKLESELGRGVFGRVFLAYQGELADRPVALKIIVDDPIESQTLAQLQHTNIVPIYSLHRAQPYQAVCMPYFGSTTLCDLLREIEKELDVPLSGKMLVSTILECRRKTIVSSRTQDRRKANQTEFTAKGTSSASAAAMTPERQAPNLERFAESTFTETVLWMGARLADALSHAHERGIVHRDIKPANILITDDGQPMLLDFNLAEDTKETGAAAQMRMGGTLPYMSPEQLTCFYEKPTKIDHRSDIYSLGIILYELLTCRHAFNLSLQDYQTNSGQIIRDRQAWVPKFDRKKSRISPAVESIVRKCVAADPNHRYQSAKALAEDINRHLANLPLMHAPDRNLLERTSKWARRHPRLSSATTILLTVFLLGSLTVGSAYSHWSANQARLKTSEAANQRSAGLQILADLKVAKDKQRLRLQRINPTAGDLAQGMQESELAVARLPLPNSADWNKHRAIQGLTEGERNALRETMFDVYVNWADALVSTASQRPGAAKSAAFKKADVLGENALAAKPAGERSKTYLHYRMKLAQARNQRLVADQFENRWLTNPNQDAEDFYSMAREFVRQQEWSKAVPLLQDATRTDPKFFWGWYLLGCCYAEQMRIDDAAAALTAALALAPEGILSYHARFARGQAYLVTGRDPQARQDFEDVLMTLERFPSEIPTAERAKVQLNLAILKQRANDLAGAMSVLNVALEQPEQRTALLLTRAGVRRQMGNSAESDKDLKEVLALTPEDEVAFNLRGLSRIEKDPQGALADFRRALELNPGYYSAKQNIAHVYSERLGKPQDAIETLNQVIAEFPGFTTARMGRAVLLARLNRRTEAHQEAEEALKRERSGATLYQAANVYALTSRVEPNDAAKVPTFLAAALMSGFGMDIVDRDSDMDAVRSRSDFGLAIRTVRDLNRDDSKPGTGKD